MKRRLMLALAMCLILISGIFSIPAAADSGASKVELYCTVNPDGDCLVSMNVTFHMEGSDKNLTFPLPGNAEKIRMNGGSVATSSSGNVILAAVGSATGGMAGDFTVRFDFTLPEVVKVNANRELQLDLPLLCGFSYPVANLSFVITLPANLETTPSFYSTYQQAGFDSNLELTIKDNMLTGISKSGLNDHEAVYLTAIVPTSMFPSVSTYQRTGNPELYPMGAFVALALLYWLIFLRTLPPIRSRATTPPAGIAAGELGCRLTMEGGDLSMLVLSWAQLGYLLIQLEGQGRILLHKRMDMGNERSLFEVRLFQTLFGNRRVIDCGGLHYAKTIRRAKAMVPGERSMCKPGSGNRKIFRGLFCIMMFFCGICVAMNMTGILVLQILFSCVFGVLGIVTAWQMHNLAPCLFLRHKGGIFAALGCFVIWILLGLLCHQVWIPLGAALLQIAAGFFSWYGGRRTELNRSEAGEILGLRRYLKKLSKEDALRIQKNDPEFFFRMAPYAIAMGVSRPFAAAFGTKKLDQCPYLVTRVHGRRTAQDWMRLLNQSVSVMDARYHRMELEKWMAIRFR